MSCTECQAKIEDINNRLNRIELGINQIGESTNWIVQTVTEMVEGIGQMMNAGGPLAMINQMRRAKKEAKNNG